jgi:hypothetical protein
LYDTFIPGITTHIITQYPDKELLGKAGSTDNTVGPFVITKQWLIDSVLDGKREDETHYLPPNMEQVNNSCIIQQVSLQKKKSNIIGTVFKSCVFSITTESYSEIETEEITTKIESNGGSVVSEHIQNNVAKYLIMNDGYHDWKGFALEKNEDGKYVVSHRFLDHCLNHKQVVRLKDEKAMDLLPLPYSVPYTGLRKVCVAFTLFSNNSKDKVVLENLAALMGMEVEFSQDKTTHLVVNSEKMDQIKQSAKIETIKRSFMVRQPKVVLFEWFLQ